MKGYVLQHTKNAIFFVAYSLELVERFLVDTLDGCQERLPRYFKIPAGLGDGRRRTRFHRSVRGLLSAKVVNQGDV